jgi:hypothetical protein
MLRFFFDGGTAPPGVGQSPGLVVKDHRELERAVKSGEIGGRRLREDELNLLRAVLARLGEGASNVDVVGNPAVFRVFPRAG